MKNPISEKFLKYQAEKLSDPEYYRELVAQAISQFKNKLSYRSELLKKVMQMRSVKGAKEYGDASFLTADLEESIFEEVIDILNYTMMIKFLDGEGRD